MRGAVFAGTFDPVTNGHLDLMQRAIRMFDSLTVAVAERAEKGVIFTQAERVEMIREASSSLGRITVEPFAGLLVDFAKQRKIPILVRGLRFISDFEYEFQMALMNRRLHDEIETVFLMPSETYTYLNASLVKEIARYGGAIEGLVPPNVAARLRERLRQAR
ncbi:MAG: pantetheine-phosphate adenylyltransferase [Candidatus Eisenbacteria bacterium]|uniref:Phosphopantetheine adenylyltransferase n=1 Tax=Eiseniibacteriota bacterium TaxID=2212470 RepID=A0A538TA96_UNCEI|nr:MAG: pantetheine-phosphate adenylyltransferase [Candidatus Eisenbacteria bacterium]